MNKVMKPDHIIKRNRARGLIRQRHSWLSTWTKGVPEGRKSSSSTSTGKATEKNTIANCEDKYILFAVVTLERLQQPKSLEKKEG